MAFVNEYVFTMEQMSSPIRYHLGETFGEQIGRSSMSKGPQGQQRPADLIGCAVRVMQIATGKIEETSLSPCGRVRGGRSDAMSRAEQLT